MVYFSCRLGPLLIYLSYLPLVAHDISLSTTWRSRRQLPPTYLLRTPAFSPSTCSSTPAAIFPITHSNSKS
jgi:hypothetical protein